MFLGEVFGTLCGWEEGLVAVGGTAKWLKVFGFQSDFPDLGLGPYGKTALVICCQERGVASGDELEFGRWR